MGYATALVIIASIAAAVVVIKFIIDGINELIRLKTIVIISENAIEIFDDILDTIFDRLKELKDL